MAHTAISIRQNARRNARVAAGQARWGSSLQQELGYTARDFGEAGFGWHTTRRVMQQQYGMLDAMGVPYTQIPGF